MLPEASMASVSPAPAGPHAQPAADVPARAIINIRAFQGVRMGAVKMGCESDGNRVSPEIIQPGIRGQSSKISRTLAWLKSFRPAEETPFGPPSNRLNADSQRTVG